MPTRFSLTRDEGVVCQDTYEVVPIIQGCGDTPSEVPTGSDEHHQRLPRCRPDEVRLETRDSHLRAAGASHERLDCERERRRKQDLFHERHEAILRSFYSHPVVAHTAVRGGFVFTSA